MPCFTARWMRWPLKSCPPARATGTPSPPVSRQQPGMQSSSKKDRYPALYRLKRRGWVESEWGWSELRRHCVDLGRKRDREMRLTQWLEEIENDVRFAGRQLRRAPAFAFIAAVTLALGIGANGAIFGLVDATLLRPLPFAEPDRLVRL